MSALAHLQTHLDKWRLTLGGAPFETHSSWLAYVRRGETQAVLKMPKPESDEQDGARILLHWGDEAAVRVLEHDQTALLTERVRPGTELAELVVSGRDADATHIWCDVVQRLHRKAPPRDWPGVEQRGRSFKRKHPDHPLLTPELIARATEEYFDLCATQSQQQFLLHADLNHFNILEDEKRGWLVIDPKGFAGELEWETATFLRNPIPHWDFFSDPDVMEDRVAILCERLPLDATRVLRWCFAQSVLSAIWSAEGHGDDAKLEGALDVAIAADELLSA